MNDDGIDKPTVQLIGRDGNAYMILGSCLTAARKAGWSKEKMKDFEEKATAGDYDCLLRVVRGWFNIK